MFDASKLEYDANVAATKAAARLGAPTRAVAGSRTRRGRRQGRRPRPRRPHRPRRGGRASSPLPASTPWPSRSAARTPCRRAPPPSTSTSSPGCARPCRCRWCCTAHRACADEDLRKAVSAGITKINIGTLLNIRFTAAVRAHLAQDDAVTDPRKYLDAGAGGRHGGGCRDDLCDRLTAGTRHSVTPVDQTRRLRQYPTETRKPPMPIATPQAYRHMLETPKVSRSRSPRSTAWDRKRSTPHSKASPTAQRRHHPILNRRSRVRLRNWCQGYGHRGGGIG